MWIGKSKVNGEQSTPPLPEPQGWVTGSGGESVGWEPHFCSHLPPWEYKGKQWGPASEHPNLDTMKIPVLSAVVLLSLLALHSAQGAALGSSKVSTSSGLSFSYTYYLTYSSIYLPSIHYWISGSYFLILSGVEWEVGALRKERKEEGNKTFLGRPVGREMLIFLEGMVKYGVDKDKKVGERSKGSGRESEDSEKRINLLPSSHQT